jgi:hypothetical protein
LDDLIKHRTIPICLNVPNSLKTATGKTMVTKNKAGNPYKRGWHCSIDLLFEKSRNLISKAADMCHQFYKKCTNIK